MFNREVASRAKDSLKAAVVSYNQVQAGLQQRAEWLYELRLRSGQVVIEEAESFISSIADHPKEFDRTVADFRFNFENFNSAARDAQRQFEDAAVHSSTAGIGVAAGAATALMGPTAAMAIATTFGTASTGTAIASLSGAAATKAALAWLGGGALAAGGGGMASGGALLALAGPIGWTAAGLAAAGGLFYFSSANSKVAKEADEKALQIEKATKVVELSFTYVHHLGGLTTKHIEGLTALLSKARTELPKSYREFSPQQLEMVAALVNHVNALSLLLKKTVTEYLTRIDAVKAAESKVFNTKFRAFAFLKVEKSDETTIAEMNANAEFAEAQAALRSYGPPPEEAEFASDGA